MRQRLYGGWLLAMTAAAMIACPTQAQAQVSDYAVSGLPTENVPIPTGNPGTHGFYTFFQFSYLTMTRPIGDQIVAYRGLVDSQGLLTGLPGTYIGSGVPGLSTSDLPRRSWMPGFTLGLGYKLDDGTSIYGSYMYMEDATSSAAATLASPFFRSRADLSDTFLVAGVFNFPPQYAGPLQKTPADDDNFNGVPDATDGNRQLDAGEGGNFYGIWNGASDMVISFTQRFAQGEIGARVPLFQTEYSRIYGLGGLRFNWFMERFQWRTVAYDLNGVARPFDTATYKNTLSQRMYGPFIGCGHEIYLGKRFSLSSDLTAAGLVNVVKERAKYKLGDSSIQNKLSRNELTVVPSFTANVNLWWYPIEGVQMQLGYQAWTFFNTKSMEEPIGFNYGVIDPAYRTQYFRVVHGLNAGVGLFF